MNERNIRNNTNNKKVLLEEARKINNLWDNDIKNIMSIMQIKLSDFSMSEDWLKYQMTERAKILMEQDLNAKAYKVNDQKKLMINYIIDSKNETIKFNKPFTNQFKKDEIANLMEARCGLFPCNENFFHSKPHNKLHRRCRWCEKYDCIENESHLFNKCKKSPIYKSIEPNNFKDLCFGDLIDPNKLLTSTMTRYKSVLKKRGEKT